MTDYRRPARRAAGGRSRRLAGRRRCCYGTATNWPTGPEPGSSWSASPCATSTRRATTDLPTRAASRPTPRALIVGADIVIELIGGIEPARTHMLQAINSGADVVTANKALLATHGPEIFDAADQVGAQVYYEAAAAGAIPIIRPLRDSLAGDRVQRIMGIVNGTTNYILDRMDTEGAEFARCARRRAGARLRGGRPHRRRRRLRRRAEGRDPREPRLPHDRAPRGGPPRGHHRHRQGDDGCCAPRGLRGQAARRLRALSTDRRRTGVDLGAACTPRSSPRSHPLASVHGANNAVFVQAEAAGNLMFYGAGAGGVQTASAVLGDVVSAARRHIAGGVGVGESTRANLPIVPIGRRHHPLPDHPRGRRPARRARDRRRHPQRRTRLDRDRRADRRDERTATPAPPAWSSAPTRPWSTTSARRSTASRRAASSSASSRCCE